MSVNVTIFVFAGKSNVLRGSDRKEPIGSDMQ